MVVIVTVTDSDSENDNENDNDNGYNNNNNNNNNDWYIHDMSCIRRTATYCTSFNIFENQNLHEKRL